MAAYWTNRGKARLASAGVTGKTFVLLLVKDTAPASAAAAADLNAYSEITNHADFTNYPGAATGLVLTSVTVTEDDTNDRASLVPAPTSHTINSAGGTTNNTVVGGWLVERAGASLVAGDNVWCWLGMTSITTNGGNLTINYGANGISLVN